MGEGCCTPDDWQREAIPDHKFDYVNVDDFIDESFLSKVRYSFVFLFTLKSILVYMSDVGIVVINLANLNALTELLNVPDGKCTPDELDRFGLVLCNSTTASIQIPFAARLGIIFGSIALSFLLLFLEWRKAQKIIKSRDISYAFTSIVAYRYYVIQSYPHFCFFSQIENSRRTVDILAFFVFFQFRGWKKLLLAEFPRVFIYAVLLFTLFGSAYNQLNPQTVSPFARPFLAIYTAFQSASTNPVFLAQYVLMSFSTLIWAVSFISLLAAFFVYVPLLSKIRGNLKEYCCHKIDKRISQILKRKTRKRIEEARKAELENASSSASNTQSRSNNHQNYRDDSMSDYSSSVGGNGSAYGGAGGHPRLAAPPLGMKIAPTLPDVNIDEAEMMGVGGGSGVVMYHQPQQMQQYTRHQQPRYARSDYGGSDYGGSDGTGGTMQSRNGGNPGAFYITSNQNHGIPPIPALPPIHGSSPSGVDNRYYQQQHYYAQYYPSLVHQQYHQQQYSQSATTVQSSSFNENNNSNRVGGGGVVMGRESFPDSQQDLISRDDEGSGTPPPELLYPGMQGHPMTK